MLLLKSQTPPWTRLMGMDIPASCCYIRARVHEPLGTITPYNNLPLWGLYPLFDNATPVVASRAGDPSSVLSLALIHPSAWNRYSRKFASSIMHSPGPPME